MSAHSKKQKQTESPSQDVGNNSQEEVVKQPGTGAFSNLSRSLNEANLKNPAVGKLLLEKIDILSSEKIVLEGFRDKFYDADKRVGILEEKSQSQNKFQILYSACLTMGGTVFGIAFATEGPLRIVLIVSGVLLFGVGTILTFFVNTK